MKHPTACWIICPTSCWTNYLGVISFIPEYAGKLNFYLSAVDSLVKQDELKSGAN
jgi:hypothetical protein